jgi:hypothetical protein
MEAGAVPVVLDGAEVEEEPSPNLIDHHLLQSYKTLHQKLTKKCVVPISVRLLCQSWLADDGHALQALRVQPAVQHRRGPYRGALVDRPGQAVPGPAPSTLATLAPACFAHSWPRPDWAMTPMWRLPRWPRHAASRPWATPPSRPTTSSMPVLVCCASCVCRVSWLICVRRAGHMFFGLQMELEETKSLNFEENVAHAIDCYVAAIKVPLAVTHTANYRSVSLYDSHAHAHAHDQRHDTRHARVHPDTLGAEEGEPSRCPLLRNGVHSGGIPPM